MGPSHSAYRYSDSPLRVLFFDHVAAESGGEIPLLNLVEQLDTSKVLPIVVFGADGPVVEKMSLLALTRVVPLPDEIAGARKDSLGVASLVQLRAVYSAALYVLRLASFIRRNDVDLVHTNSLKADLLGGIAARLARRPVVWHIRDRIEDDYLPKSVVRLFRVLTQWIPHFIIANSEATLRTLRLNASRPTTHLIRSNRHSRRSAVVHDGTHLRPPAKKAPANAGRWKVGLIGRICRWKGQHIFLRAAAIVHRYFPDAHFVIVGSALFGEAGYAQEVRLLAETLGIADSVNFLGFRTDVHDVIAEMDLIVHASIIGEPFGQVIIEGMAAGKPVIATHGGGIPEIVEDRRSGIVVPMGDVQAMADAICRVLADPVLATAMGDRGREIVRERFTIQNTARKIEAIYQSLVAG
jgi:glycosyltransferase involved in cell wall biosynthesis